MAVVVEVTGLQRALKRLDVPKYHKAVSRVVTRGSQIWRDETKKLRPVSGPRDGYSAKGIPVDTGRLRQSIAARRMSDVAAEVFAPVQYSGYVHEGTGRVQERPFFKWALELGAAEKIGAMIADEITKALDGQ